MIVDKMKKREPTAKKIKNKVDIPVGKWIKCDKCQEILYKEDVRKNNSICPNCGAYFRMHINKRLESILDKESYKRFDLDIETDVEHRLLKTAIGKLSGRERMIIELRFGLNSIDGEEKTQKEVADMLGISQSYISRLEKKIMGRLKKEIVRLE